MSSPANRNVFLSGVPLVTIVLELPLRLESVNDRSGIRAGIDILPFTATIALGSAITGGLTVRGRVPLIFVLAVGSILQILGMGLLYSVHANSSLPASIYGYQILVGLGSGLSLTTLLDIVPFIVDRRVLGMCPCPQICIFF